MSRHPYQLLLVLAPVLAIAGAIAGAVGGFRAAVVLIALAVACVPVLLHMQTQRIVVIARTSESRLEKALVKRLGTSRGADVSTREAIEQNDATAQILAALDGLTARTTPGSLDSTANELRREARMTRLVMTQLLEAQGRTGTVPGSVAPYSARGEVAATSSEDRL